MVKQIRSLGQLKFGQLMAVYEEGNVENGQENYPQMTVAEQLMAAEQDFYQYLKLFFAESESYYMVYEHNGQYASALRLEPYKDGLLLEALETKPELRRKGFAENLIRETLLALPREISVVYSHVSKTNTASIKIHEKCGFQKLLNYAVYIDGSVNERAFTYIYRIEKPLEA